MTRASQSTADERRIERSRATVVVSKCRRSATAKKRVGGGLRGHRQSPGSAALSILVDAKARAPRRHRYRQRTGADVTQDIDIKALIRTVPDFPKPGVLFRDITTLLKQADGFHAVIEKLGAAYRGSPIDKIAAIESRGFIIGAALAYMLRVGLVPIRKKGK